jgi:hypothetical protein
MQSQDTAGDIFDGSEASNCHPEDVDFWAISSVCDCVMLPANASGMVIT